MRKNTVYARKSQNTLKKTNYSSTAVRGASVQCAEKYSVSVRSKKCLRIQCAGRYNVCTQVTKYAEKKKKTNTHHAKIRCLDKVLKTREIARTADHVWLVSNRGYNCNLGKKTPGIEIVEVRYNLPKTKKVNELVYSLRVSLRRALEVTTLTEFSTPPWLLEHRGTELTHQS